MNKRIKTLILVVLGILLVSGISGCIQCNKPYIQVGSECCLDTNDNSICDRDEVQNESKTELKGECMLKSGDKLMSIGKICKTDQECIAYRDIALRSIPEYLVYDVKCIPLSPYKALKIDGKLVPCYDRTDCLDAILSKISEDYPEKFKEGIIELMICENNLCNATEEIIRAFFPEELGYYTSEKCIIDTTGSGLFCDENLVNADSMSDQINMGIKNILTDSVVINSIKVGTICTNNVIDEIIAPDTYSNIIIPCTGLIKGKLNVDLIIKYTIITDIGNFSKTAPGSLSIIVD